MPTSGEIALVSSGDQRLLVSPDEEPGLSDQEHGSLDEEQGLLDKVGDLESRDTILLVSAEEQGLGDIDKIYEMECKHTIFLSHSGAQKNFVEQLCEDLERAKMSAFFDRRPESLPKGEVFAPHIFQAADQCDLAVVVVSEDYFSRGKWPMLELCAFVKSSKPKVILPLFFGLSFRDFSNPERRKLWFETWQAWAEADARIRVEDWKMALKELDRRNGLHYVEVLGEVDFRKDVVRAAYAITQKILQEKVNRTTLISFSFFISASENKVALRA